MTAREQGFLLLTSELGVSGRKTLTDPQLRTLAKRVQQARWENLDRDLLPSDLMALGYGKDMAERITVLLEDRELLTYYLQRGKKAGCYPLSRVTEGYPESLRKALGWESPGCLWYKGDLALLSMPKVALVGSRELKPDNQAFAREVGRQAAMQGYVLVSGNARGADKTAQEACLRAGGKVICVVADSLLEHTEQDNVLYLSEDDFDAQFSAQRALSRNRVIHALGATTFVAQCGYQTGGTWDGTVKNLRFGWSDVYCYGDGSPAQRLLEDMGALTIDIRQLENLNMLPRRMPGLLDREEET